MFVDEAAAVASYFALIGFEKKIGCEREKRGEKSS